MVLKLKNNPRENSMLPTRAPCLWMPPPLLLLTLRSEGCKSDPSVPPLQPEREVNGARSSEPPLAYVALTRPDRLDGLARERDREARAVTRPPGRRESIVVPSWKCEPTNQWSTTGILVVRVVVVCLLETDGTRGKKKTVVLQYL